MKAPRVVVIGGVNMDICGKSSGKLLLRDSNPGSVTLHPGGVGRNIAHDLRLLGAEVSLIAAIGGDVYGTAIGESCRALGLDMSMALLLPDRRSSTYLYVADESGDMCVAVNDMGITAAITPEYIAGLMPRINEADAVVIDANLGEETIEYICSHCSAPIYAEPVSCAKAGRLMRVLPKLTAIKPNLMEAQLLTGLDDPDKAAAALAKAGVKRAFVSLGSEGISTAEGNEVFRVPAVEAQVVNTTGAGDAAFAAIVLAGMRGLSARKCAEYAVLAGAVACESAEANNPRLSELKIV